MSVASAPALDSASLQQRAAANFRVFCFWLLFAAVALHAAIVGMPPRTKPLSLLIVAPPYVLWILSDLNLRRVSGFAFALQFALALVPVLGLPVYLLVSRGLLGLLQFLGLLLAFALAALVAAGASTAILV